jgi:hypothetical protein
MARARSLELTAAQARATALAFLDAWAPFRERFTAPGDVRVDRLDTVAAPARWIATATPAFDVRCVVIIDDAGAAVVEARLVALRGGTVLARWPQAPTAD